MFYCSRGSGDYLSHLSWVRGLKLRNSINVVTQQASHLSWVRGLKCNAICHKATNI